MYASETRKQGDSQGRYLLQIAPEVARVFPTVGMPGVTAYANKCWESVPGIHLH